MMTAKNKNLCEMHSLVSWLMNAWTKNVSNWSLHLTYDYRCIFISCTFDSIEKWELWQVLQDRTHNMVELCRVVRNDWTLCINTCSQAQNVAPNLCSSTFWCLHNLNVWMSQTVQPRPSLGFTKVKIQQLGLFSAALSFLLEHAGPAASVEQD